MRPRPFVEHSSLLKVAAKPIGFLFSHDLLFDPALVVAPLFQVLLHLFVQPLPCHLSVFEVLPPLLHPLFMFLVAWNVMCKTRSPFDSCVLNSGGSTGGEGALGASRVVFKNMRLGLDFKEHFFSLLLGFFRLLEHLLLLLSYLLPHFLISSLERLCRLRPFVTDFSEADFPIKPFPHLPKLLHSGPFVYIKQTLVQQLAVREPEPFDIFGHDNISTRTL